MREYCLHGRILLSTEDQIQLENLRIFETNHLLPHEQSIYAKFIADLSRLDVWIAAESQGRRCKPFPEDIRVSKNEYFHQIDGELGNHYGYKYVFNKGHKYIQAMIKDLQCPPTEKT